MSMKRFIIKMIIAFLCYNLFGDYYGFYSLKNRKLLEKVYKLYDRKIKKHVKNIKQRKIELKNKLNKLKYRTHMIQSYERDPLLCSCGSPMKFEVSYNPFEGGTPNDRHYREKCLISSRNLARQSRRVYYD